MGNFMMFLANSEAAKKLCGSVTVNNGKLRGEITDVGQIVQLVGKIVSIFQIAIPIILVVMGLVSLGKAVVASKDDEVKKATGGLVKKIILAAAIFFVVTIVKMVVSLVGGDEMKHCWEIINNPWDSSSWDEGNCSNPPKSGYTEYNSSLGKCCEPGSKTKCATPKK